MNIDVIVGGLYGDEGKGKVVSFLGNNYDYIFRVNSSTNATHTVKLDNGDTYVTRQLPSVFNNDKVKFVIGPGALLNLNAFKEELLFRGDLKSLKNRITVASSISLLIEPYKERNKVSKQAQKYGSTNQGTGNAVLARVDRHSIKLVDLDNYFNNLLTKEELTDKIRNTCEELDYYYFKNKEEKYYEEICTNLINDYKEIKELIGDFSYDYTNFLYKMDKNANILIEGCNGVMLDLLHGLNPYTTSASTSINALLNGANLSPYDLRDTYFIIAGYFCCLNKRPFITEMTEDEAEKLFRYNSEVDDSEGMRRRLGWFDMPTLKKALIGHKNCKLVLNKLDIMRDLEEIKICDYYLDGEGNKIYIMPDNTMYYEKLKPHYITMKGFQINDKTISKELEDFIKYIESETDRKIVFLGVGRRVNDLINIDN